MNKNRLPDERNPPDETFLKREQSRKAGQKILSEEDGIVKICRLLAEVELATKRGETRVGAPRRKLRDFEPAFVFSNSILIRGCPAAHR